MYEVKVVSRFAAAHYLQNYKGKCESLHGHNWKVEAIVSSPVLDTRDMVVDFKELKGILGDVLARLDHSLLNDASFFKGKNTTSERIAQYVFDEMKGKLDAVKRAGTVSGDIAIKEVAIWEQEDSCAVYREAAKE